MLRKVERYEATNSEFVAKLSNDESCEKSEVFVPKWLRQLFSIYNFIILLLDASVCCNPLEQREFFFLFDTHFNLFPT